MGGWIGLWMVWAAGSGLAQQAPTEATPPDATAERETGQSIDGNRLVDHDLRYALDGLDPGWVVMDRVQAATVAPNAECGVLHPSLGWLLVVVEPARSADLDAFHAELEGVREGVVPGSAHAERTEFQGKPAWHSVHEVRLDGRSQRVESYELLSEGWLYQVLLVEPARPQPAVDDRPRMFEVFSLLPGPPRARQVRPLADVATSQWDVRDGTYEDAVYGLRWTPGPDSRIAVGEELAGMDGEARVGVSRNDPSLYVTLTPEVIGPGPAGPFGALIREGWALDHGHGEPLAPVVLQVAGQVVEFVGFRLDGVTRSNLWLGLVHHGSVLVRVQFWYPDGPDTEALLAEAARLVAAVTFLDPAERQAAQDRLADARQPSAVGPAWRWRDGVFEDYARDLSWVAPTALWEVLGGQAVMDSHGPEGAFFLEERARGLMAVVRVLDEPGTPRQILEARLREEFEDPGRLRLSRVSLADTKAVGATLSGWNGDVEYVWRYAAASAGPGRTVLVEGWSLASQAGPAAEAFDALLGGLAVTRPVLDSGFDTGGFHSARLGIRQATLPGFRCADATPPQLTATAVMLSCTAGPEQLALALAVHGVPSGVGQDLRLEMISNMLAGNPLSRGREWTTTDGTLAGRPATRVELAPPGPPVELAVAASGSVVLISMTVGLEPAQADHWLLGLSVLP